MSQNNSLIKSIEIGISIMIMTIIHHFFKNQLLLGLFVFLLCMVSIEKTLKLFASLDRSIPESLEFVIYTVFFVIVLVLDGTLS